MSAASDDAKWPSPHLSPEHFDESDTEAQNKKSIFVDQPASGQVVEAFFDANNADAHKFKQLSWVQLAVLLIVEAIALGSLSLPSAYDTVGMAGGVIITFVVGLITLYTSYVIGQACNRFPDEIVHYNDVARLMFGRVGGEICGVAFVIFLTLANASHTLTGSIAFKTISDGRACTLFWSGISAIILFLLALPRTFSEVAILGYLDFISIIAAILITIIATGINTHGGRGVDWHAAAPTNPAPTFATAIVAVVNIAFAFSFVVNQPSFQTELKNRREYLKSITLLIVAEWVIYILTGALIYAFVGKGVPSPALLAAGHTVRRVGFGVALIVIFVSGSINTVAAGRYLHYRIFKGTPHQFISTRLGVVAWVAIIGILTVIGWVLAVAIPFFNDLLGIISALCVSGFSFYLPGFCWFILLKEGSWRKSLKNILLSIVNLFIILLGFFFLVGGIYGSVVGIRDEYKNGQIGKPFQCTWDGGRQ